MKFNELKLSQKYEIKLLNQKTDYILCHKTDLIENKTKYTFLSDLGNQFIFLPNKSDDEEIMFVVTGPLPKYDPNSITNQPNVTLTFEIVQKIMELKNE